MPNDRWMTAPEAGQELLVSEDWLVGLSALGLVRTRPGPFFAGHAVSLYLEEDVLRMLSEDATNVLTSSCSP